MGRLRWRACVLKGDANVAAVSAPEIQRRNSRGAKGQSFIFDGIIGQWKIDVNLHPELTMTHIICTRRSCIFTMHMYVYVPSFRGIFISFTFTARPSLWHRSCLKTADVRLCSTSHSSAGDRLEEMREGSEELLDLARVTEPIGSKQTLLSYSEQWQKMELRIAQCKSADMLYCTQCNQPTLELLRLILTTTVWVTVAATWNFTRPLLFLHLHFIDFCRCPTEHSLRWVSNSRVA